MEGRKEDVRGVWDGKGGMDGGKEREGKEGCRVGI